MNKNIYLATSLLLQEVNHHILVNEFVRLAGNSQQLQELKIDLFPEIHQLFELDNSVSPDAEKLWCVIRDRCVNDNANRISLAKALINLLARLTREANE